MAKKKSYIFHSINDFLKNLSLGLAIFLFLILILRKHSFYLELPEKKTPVITTIFSAKNIELLSQQKDSLSIYASAQNLDFLYEKNEPKSIVLEGNSKVKGEGTNFSYKIHSNKMNITFGLTGKNKNLNTSTFSEVELLGNVKIFSDSSLLKTEQAFFFPKENIFASKILSKFLSEHGYLESKNGFEWDMQKKIFSIKKGFNGISHQ